MNSQREFTKTFGSSPTLLNAFPVPLKNDDLLAKVSDFKAACALKIFLHICHLDYVGRDKDGNSLTLVELGSSLSKLKQK